MRFALFLDVDGVLNTSSTCQHTPSGYVGIDNPRVEVLAKSLQMYDCFEIILTSDWKEMKEDDDDYLYLVEKLGLYGLHISEKTSVQANNRGEGIIDFLEKHPEIDDFVILDDHTYDFMIYERLWESFLLTDGIEKAKFASETPAVEAMIFLDYIKQFS